MTCCMICGFGNIKFMKIKVYFGKNKNNYDYICDSCYYDLESSNEDSFEKPKDCFQKCALCQDLVFEEDNILFACCKCGDLLCSGCIKSKSEYYCEKDHCRKS